MKVRIIYDSAYGNTEKIAYALAEGLDSDIAREVCLVSNMPTDELLPGDLLVVGSPTQGGRPTQAIQNYLKEIPHESLSGIYAAAFDTRFAINEHGVGLKFLMKTIGFAAPRIAAGLLVKGATPLMEPEGFIVDDTKGPLKAGELTRAKRWMQSVINEMKGY